MRDVFRCHARGLLWESTENNGEVQALLGQCHTEAKKLVQAGEMMTAGLFQYGRQLFLYYEALGEEFPPERFMAPLHDALIPWPQKEEMRDWARMYHVYWHCEPRNESDWKREKKPLRRRGRIAYLKTEGLFDYVYHHTAIVREGLLKGDRYMSIALHEDVLFSYFEEPRSSVNIRRTEEGESIAIQRWMEAGPEDHFIHLPGSEGQNFLLLPEVFSIGQEDFHF